MALHFSLDTARPPHRRLIAAGALMLMLLTIGLTLSRGGLLALGVALLVVLAGAREPLRALGWVVLTAVASAPALVFGLASHPLTSAGVDLSSREQAGAIFAGIVVASLIALGLRGRAVIAVEPRLRLVAARARHAGAVGMSALVMLVVTAVVAAILTHAVHNFTSPTAPSNVNPNRLLTTDSYRWLWWREAASAFSDRPLGGWGAGSFGAVHLIYRRNTLPVQQPHSVPSNSWARPGLSALSSVLAARPAAGRGRQKRAPI